MLMLTLNEWIGPHLDAPNPSKPVEHAIAMTTRLTLGEALYRLLKYQEAYNKCWYPHTQVTFTLTGLSELNNCGISANVSEKLSMLGVEFVEDLTVEDEPILAEDTEHRLVEVLIDSGTPAQGLAICACGWYTRWTAPNAAETARDIDVKFTQHRQE